MRRAGLCLAFVAISCGFDSSTRQQESEDARLVVNVAQSGVAFQWGAGEEVLYRFAAEDPDGTLTPEYLTDLMNRTLPTQLARAARLGACVTRYSLQGDPETIHLQVKGVINRDLARSAFTALAFAGIYRIQPTRSISEAFRNTAKAAASLDGFVHRSDLAGKFLVAPDRLDAAVGFVENARSQRDFASRTEVAWGLADEESGGGSFSPLYVLEDDPILTGTYFRALRLVVGHDVLLGIRTSNRGGRQLDRALRATDDVTSHVLVIWDSGKPSVVAESMTRVGQVDVQFAIPRYRLGAHDEQVLKLLDLALPVPLQLLGESVVRDSRPGELICGQSVRVTLGNPRRPVAGAEVVFSPFDLDSLRSELSREGKSLSDTELWGIAAMAAKEVGRPIATSVTDADGFLAQYLQPGYWWISSLIQDVQGRETYWNTKVAVSTPPRDTLQLTSENAEREINP